MPATATPEFLRYSPQDIVKMGQERGLAPEEIAQGVLNHRNTLEEWGREHGGEEYFNGAVRIDNDTESALSGLRPAVQRQVLTRELPDPVEQQKLAAELQKHDYDVSKLPETYQPVVRAAVKAGQDLSLPQERYYGAKVTAGGRDLAHFTLRKAGDGMMDVGLTIPDPNDPTKESRALVRVPHATAEDVQAEIEKRKELVKKQEEAIKAQDEMRASDPEGGVSSSIVTATQQGQVDALKQSIEALKRDGPEALMNERVREELKKPEWRGKIGQYAGGIELYKGLENAEIFSAALLARAGQIVGAPGADKTMRDLAEIQSTQDLRLGGSTRRALEGGLWNDSVKSAQQSLGQMAPFMVGGMAVRAGLGAAGGEGMAANELAAQQAGRLGAAGAGMSASAAGSAELETQRKIDAAVAAGDTAKAARLRAGRDIHALLTGVTEGAVERLGAGQAQNIFRGGVGHATRELGKEGVEEVFTGGIQRAVVDPVALDERPDVFGPMPQELLTGVMAAVPISGGSAIANWNQRGTNDGLQSNEAPGTAGTNASAAGAAAPGGVAGGNPFAGPINAPPQLDEQGQEVVPGPQPVPAFLDDPYSTVAPQPAGGNVLRDFNVPRTAEAQAAYEQRQQEYAQSQAAAQGQMNRAGGRMPLIPDNPLGYRDILDFVNDNPLHIPTRGSEAAKAGEYDWTQSYEMPRYYRRFLASSEGGHNADALAQMAFDEGYIAQPTPDALMEQIDKTIRERTQHRVEFRRQQQAQNDEERRQTNFDKAQQKASPVESTVLPLAQVLPGDEFTLGTENVRVKHVEHDEDGNVTLVQIEDGKKFGVLNLDPQTRAAILVDEFKPLQRNGGGGSGPVAPNVEDADPFMPAPPRGTGLPTIIPAVSPVGSQLQSQLDRLMDASWEVQQQPADATAQQNWKQQSEAIKDPMMEYLKLAQQEGAIVQTLPAEAQIVLAHFARQEPQHTRGGWRDMQLKLLWNRELGDLAGQTPAPGRWGFHEGERNRLLNLGASPAMYPEALLQQKQEKHADAVAQEHLNAEERAQQAEMDAINKRWTKNVFPPAKRPRRAAAGARWWRQLFGPQDKAEAAQQAKQQLHERQGFIAQVWQAIAQHGDAFLYGKTTSPDAHEIAAAVSLPNYPVTARVAGSEVQFDGINGSLTIQAANTKHPYISSPLADSQGRKSGGGSQLYQAALDWIHNNGKQVRNDPSGLTTINATRRTSNMLSSALRWGTTRHLKPHRDQRVKWSDDNALNTGALAMREMDHALNAVAPARNWRYDFADGKFRDATGRVLDPKDFEQAVARGDPGYSGVGLSTLQRAIVTVSALERHERGETAAAFPGAESGAVLPSDLNDTLYMPAHLQRPAVKGPLPSNYSGAQSPTLGPVQQQTWSGEVQTLKGIRDFLLKAVGLPAVGVGRFKRALGIYRSKPESIRLQAINDIPVLAHEIGHALHYRTLNDQPGKPAPNWGGHFDGELLPLGAPTSLPNYTQDMLRKEGIAEFVRLWLTSPAQARAQAPVFSAFFEAEMEKRNPKMAEALKEAQAMIADYIAMPEFEKAKAQIVFDPSNERVGQTAGQWMRGAYAKWVDTLNPALQVTREAAKMNPSLESTARHVETLMENHRGGWSSKAHADIFGHQTDLHGNRVGPGLSKILADLQPGDHEAFSAYVALKRAMEIEAQGKRSGFENAHLPSAEMKALEARFESVRKKLLKWSNNELQLLIDGGILDGASAAAMRRANQDYVPFYRLYEKPNNVSLGPGQSRNGGGFVDLNSGIRRLKGSDRAIMDPLQSLMKNAFMFRKIAEQNNIGVQFFDLIRQVQGHGKWGEQIQPKMGMQLIKHEQIVAVLKKEGVIQDESDLPTSSDLTLRLFEAMKTPDTANGEVIIFRQGKREHWQIKDPLLMEALKTADADAVKLWKFFGPTMTKLLTLPTRVLRFGATGGPWFAIPNFIRDQFTAGLQSKSGYIPFWDGVIGAGHVLKKSDVYQRWIEAGGKFHGITTGNEAFKSLLEDALPKDASVRATIGEMMQPRNWVRMLGAAGQIMEEATRVQEFNRMQQQGATPMEAANASKIVSMNFARAGERSRAFNMLIAFLNAQIQQLDMVVNLHRDPARRLQTILRGVMLITAPSVLCWYLGKDDEEIQNLPEWRKNLFWNLNLKPVARALGRDGFILSIPKPFLMGAIYGTSVERMLDYATDRDPNGWKKALTAVIDQTIAPLDMAMSIAGLRPLAEATMNYDFFRKRPVIPEQMQDLPPAQQYDLTTSHTARLIGEYTNQSPMMIDHLVRGYFATAGKWGVGAIDWGMEKLGMTDVPPPPRRDLMEWPILNRFAGTPYAANVWLDRFYRASSDMEGLMRVWNKQADQMTTAEQKRWWEKHGAEVMVYSRTVDAKTKRTGAGDVRKALKALSEINGAMKEVQGSRILSPEVKRARLMELAKQRNMAAEAAYKNLFPAEVQRRHF